MSVDFFPIPMFDETTYSLLSRFHILSGSHSAVWTRRNLGLTDHASVMSALPRHVPEILAALPCDHPIADPLGLIGKHTILPYYHFFRGRDDCEKILRIAQGDGSWIHLLGIIACRGHGLAAENPFPAYCRSCVRDDLKAHGFSYWRRTHQLPSVRLCPWHHEPLYIARNHFFRNDRRFQGFCLPDQVSQADDPSLMKDLTNLEVERLLDLANWSQRILVTGIPLMPSDPRPFFRRTIKKNGYQKKGRRDLASLANDVSKFYGKHMTDEWGLMRKHATGKRWLMYATQSTATNTQHALRYLLLGRFLFSSFDQMVHEAACYGSLIPENSAQLPIWAKQLPALVAEHGSLSKVAVHVGSCFTTVRAVAEQMGIKSRKRCGTVTPKAREAILVCLENGEPVGEVTKSFHVSTCTVYDLLARNPESKAARNVAVHSAIRAKHRAAIETHIAISPLATRTSLRHVLPSACNWLLKHDREWFFTCLPCVKYQKHSIQIRPKGYWFSKDQQSAQKVREAVKKLLSAQRPVRLSKNCILMTAKIAAWFFRNQHHLPETLATLNTNIETLSQYHKRKIQWGVKSISDQGLVYCQRALIIVTGMDHKVLKKFEHFIQEEMQRYPFLNRRIRGDRQCSDRGLKERATISQESSV